MNIKLPAGKNVPKKQLKAYKNHVKAVITQKIALEKDNKNEKFASNARNITGKKKLN